MSDDIIKRLREAIAAGPTPGPWGASNPMSDVHSVSGPEHWQGVCRAYGRANCVYIAAASPDNIAALLDRLDKAERENERLVAKIVELVGACELLRIENSKSEREALCWQELDRFISICDPTNAAAWKRLRKRIDEAVGQAIDAAMAAEQSDERRE